MPLGIDTPLLACDIVGAPELKDGRVLLLKGRDGSGLVSKDEANVTDEKIKATSAVVKAIDPSIGMKPLTKSAAMQLKQCLPEVAAETDFTRVFDDMRKPLFEKLALRYAKDNARQKAPTDLVGSVDFMKAAFPPSWEASSGGG
ncbi:MAG: hypothetical protein Q8L49_12780 [Burkholderiaceae bacterium]|nr:hypothetical protein [Burkholderiaceae bacterium]